MTQWRPFGDDEGSEYFPFVRKEKLFIPSENSLVDRTQTFHGQLFREIKKKLWSGRREDPEISIDLNVDQDVMMMMMIPLLKCQDCNSGV